MEKEEAPVLLPRREDSPGAVANRYLTFEAGMLVLRPYLEMCGVRIIDVDAKYVREEGAEEITYTATQEIIKGMRSKVCENSKIDTVTYMLPLPPPPPPVKTEEELEVEAAAAAEAAAEAAPQAEVYSETFEEPHPNGERYIRHKASGKYMVVDPDTNSVLLMAAPKLAEAGLSAVWMKTPKAKSGEDPKPPEGWPAGQPFVPTSYLDYPHIWPAHAELNNSATKSFLCGSEPMEDTIDEETCHPVTIKQALCGVHDDLEEQCTWLEEWLDANVLIREEEERQKELEAERVAQAKAAAKEVREERKLKLIDDKDALAMERAEVEASEEEDAEARLEEIGEREAALQGEEEEIEREEEEIRAAEEELAAAEAAAAEEAEAAAAAAEEEDEEVPPPPAPPKSMMLAMKCASNGCYMALDSDGNLGMIDKLGFQGKTWVGPNAMEFEYVKYEVPKEPSYGFGGWRGLPNPLPTVQLVLSKWAGMEAKLSELRASLLPMHTESKVAFCHPAATAGLQIPVERYEAEAVEGGWPLGGGGPSILHPGAVVVPKAADEVAVVGPSDDHYASTKTVRVQVMEQMTEAMQEAKGVIEEEFRGSNCAAVVDDTGLPVDDIPPKTGSWEHLRALHHPTSKAVGIVRALLLILGESAEDLSTWEKIRKQMVFRDVRNSWLNIHERLENFKPSEVDEDAMKNAADTIKKFGGEEAARKEWLCVYLMYKWITLMILMHKIHKRTLKLQEGFERERAEPPVVEEEERPETAGTDA